MKIKIGAKEVIWSYLAMGMSMGANVIMLPFMLHYLSGDMLGLWYVFGSLGAITSLFDSGFSVTFARNITYCWSGVDTLRKEKASVAKNCELDFYLIKKVLTTCRYVYLFISLAAMLILLTGGTVYVHYVSSGVEEQDYLIAWWVYSFAVFLNLYYGYYSAFLRGVGAISSVNKNMVISRTIHIVLTVGFLCSGFGLLGVCIAYLSYGVVFRLLGKHSFYRYEEIGERLSKIRKKVDKSEIKELFSIVWHNAFKECIISVSNYICNYASTLLISFYLSLTETGIYSLSQQIAALIATVSSTLFATFGVALQEAYVTGDKNRERKIMSFIVMVYCYLFLVGTALAVTLGVSLIKIIKRDVGISVPILLLLCLYQFVLKYRNCYTAYFSNTNRVPYVKSFLASAILSLILSYISIGVFNFGIWGLVISQIVSQVVYNFWYWSYLAHKELQLTVAKVVDIGTKEIVQYSSRYIKRIFK